MPASISRAAYADMFGPTTGDKLRLADTDLIIEVEKDLTALAVGAASVGGTGENAVIYGEEVKFGGGNVVGPAIGMVLTLYTNASLVYEMRRGIMSKETYKVREEYSCCCV